MLSLKAVAALVIQIVEPVEKVTLSVKFLSEGTQ